MTQYITATVIVKRLVEENNSLFVQGDRLVLLLEQLATCDREIPTLEREIRQLVTENRRLRLQIQQGDVEVHRLRVGAKLLH